MPYLSLNEYPNIMPSTLYVGHNTLPEVHRYNALTGASFGNFTKGGPPGQYRLPRVAPGGDLFVQSTMAGTGGWYILWFDKLGQFKKQLFPYWITGTIGVGAGNIVFANDQANNVIRHDPATGVSTVLLPRPGVGNYSRLEIGPNGHLFAFKRANLDTWVGVVGRFHPTTGASLGVVTTNVPDVVSDTFTIGADNVLYIRGLNGLHKVDISTHAYLGTVPANVQGAWDIVTGPALDLFVSVNLGGVNRFDEVSGTMVSTIATGYHPYGLDMRTTNYNPPFRRKIKQVDIPRMFPHLVIGLVDDGPGILIPKPKDPGPIPWKALKEDWDGMESAERDACLGEVLALLGRSVADVQVREQVLQAASTLVAGIAPDHNLAWLEHKGAQPKPQVQKKKKKKK